ncbi:MAG: regulatory protein RecX [Bacteroidota bacterium]
MKRWCDMQERAHSEAKRKLNSWGVYGDEAENIVAELISQNYLNEERFARAFARGKSRIKSWGWMKIEMELKAKGVSGYSLKAAFEEIDREEYIDQLFSLARKKSTLIKASKPYEKRQKLLKFLVSKGYSYDDANLALQEVLD